jgi:hypothetical protein
MQLGSSRVVPVARLVTKSAAHDSRLHTNRTFALVLVVTDIESFP